MCIFSGPVGHVKNTQIFARLSGTGTQFLVYSMSYAADTEVAMILPLPIGSRNEDTAVRFIALDNYPEFFSSMADGFPGIRNWNSLPPCRSLYAAPPPLKVHVVGRYEASFVPSLSDFDRLDARFRLPSVVWKHLPQYADYGFAVFKLRVPEKKSGEEVHPMAFEFVTRHADSVFFPTVHVHDEQAHRFDYFDHFLYYQGEKAPLPERFGYYRGYPVHSGDAAKELWRLDTNGPKGMADDQVGVGYSYTSVHNSANFIDVRKTQGIVEGTECCHAMFLRGMLPNKDTVLREGMLV